MPILAHRCLGPWPRLTLTVGACLVTGAFGCGSAKPADSGVVKPVYNDQSGKLEQLTADRDRDGKIDTRAFMDGVHLKHIEIDRANRGTADRWEYYVAGVNAATGRATGAIFDKSAMLERAEEANGPDPKVITRREFYTRGVITRVEEDTDFDGRVDKWETYTNGSLQQMDLDLQGRGTPDRRLVYKADGSLDHIEADAAGTGKFVVLKGGGK